MWEQLSYDDPDLSDVFFLKDKVKLKLPKISDKYFRVEAEKLFLSNPRSFGSMAGWYNGGSDMFVDQLVSIINSKKLKNKIKMYVRIIGKLILSWRRAMERLYKPGGKHDMACRWKYRHFFKKEKKNPKLQVLKFIKLF